jgi:hypothetical protein
LVACGMPVVCDCPSGVSVVWIAPDCNFNDGQGEL